VALWQTYLNANGKKPNCCPCFDTKMGLSESTVPQNPKVYPHLPYEMRFWGSYPIFRQTQMAVFDVDTNLGLVHTPCPLQPFFSFPSFRRDGGTAMEAKTVQDSQDAVPAPGREAAMIGVGPGWMTIG
jgi:hypothetical protein